MALPLLYLIFVRLLAWLALLRFHATPTCWLPNAANAHAYAASANNAGLLSVLGRA